MEPHDSLVLESPGCRIRSRYLLVLHMPVFVDESGAQWVDAAWGKDLLLHLVYIENLVLLSPRDKVRADDLAAGRLRRLPAQHGFEVVLLPSQSSRSRAFLALPRTLLLILREVSKAEIVHSSVIGWPYPVGWLANLAAMIFRTKLLINIESAPWRSTGDGVPPFLDRVVSRVYETMAGFFATRADLLLATQPDYILGLRGPASRGAYAVVAATWIDGDSVLPRQVAEERWAANLEIPSPRLKLLFAARLVAAKGSELIVDLARRIAVNGIPVCISVIGEGDYRVKFQRESMSLGADVLQVLDPVAYGPNFFALISEHAAVIVPNLSDEQPRVVFDAFSQAVPVIASSTPGLMSCVDHGLNGWIFETGSADALYEIVSALVEQRPELRSRGLAGLEKAASHTHQNMHEIRCRLIRKVFG